MRAAKTASPYLSLLSLGLLLLALGGLGYLTFLAFVRGVLVPQEFAAYGLVLTTVAAGTASFFSPCNFTVLPSYIAFTGSGADAAPGKRFRQALTNGFIAALGVVTSVAAIGVLIGILGTGIGPQLSITQGDASPVARALRIAVGAFILSMGLVHFFGLTRNLPLLGNIAAWAIRAQGGNGPSRRSVYAYGAGYVLVGLGWVAPLLAAVAAFALATGGFLAAFLAFLLFAGTMGALMLGISLLVGTSQNALLRRLRASTRAIQRASSVLLVLVGVGLIYFTIDVGRFEAIFFP